MHEMIEPTLECRSQARAFDWALVLISQGIENSIARREEDGAWLVQVAPGDLDRARAAVDAYERENHVRWRREFTGTGMLFDGRAAIWSLALALFHWLTTQARTDFRSIGAVDHARVFAGDWWRLCTATTLHADAAHLAANATTGFVFLGLAMCAFGAGNALWLSLLGGILGNLATLFLHEAPFRSLGASGVVMAALGLLVAHSFMYSRHERPRLWLGRGVMAGALLVVLLGFSPRSDVIAHVGGFAGGVVLGLGALRFRRLLLKLTTNFATLLLTLALLVGCWALAL